MNSASNQWEADPWNASDAVAETQFAGFLERVTKPICWKKLSQHDWSNDHLFGHDRQWFLDKDVEFFATHDGEDFVLMQQLWHGFPDPPEWRLASRSVGQDNRPWGLWGYFVDLPEAWVFPGN